MNSATEEEVQQFCHHPNAVAESPLLLVPLEQLRQVAATPCGRMIRDGRRKLLNDEDILTCYGPSLLLYDLSESYDVCGS